VDFAHNYRCTDVGSSGAGRVSVGPNHPVRGHVPKPRPPRRIDDCPEHPRGTTALRAAPTV